MYESKAVFLLPYDLRKVPRLRLHPLDTLTCVQLRKADRMQYSPTNGIALIDQLFSEPVSD